MRAFFLLVPALAKPPDWAVGWGGLDRRNADHICSPSFAHLTALREQDPANADAPANLRQERDEAR